MQAVGFTSKILAYGILIGTDIGDLWTA